MLEQDRYQHSPKLYILGIIALMLFWAFLLIALYIIPYLVWHFHYDVPEFIISWQFFLEDEFEYSTTVAEWLTFLTFAVPAMVCMAISWFVSYTIDKHLIMDKELAERNAVPISEGPKKQPVSSRPIAKDLSFATKLFLWMSVALVILFFIEWLITVPPPTS